MAKVVGIIEFEINEDEGDTIEDIVKCAKDSFDMDIQDKVMSSARLEWKPVEKSFLL